MKSDQVLSLQCYLAKVREELLTPLLVRRHELVKAGAPQEVIDATTVAIESVKECFEEAIDSTHGSGPH
jgi:hypothetical protein